MLGIEAGVWIFRQGAGCQSGLGASDHLRCLAEAESQVTFAAHVFSGFTLGTGLSRPARKCGARIFLLARCYGPSCQKARQQARRGVEALNTRVGLAMTRR